MKKTGFTLVELLAVIFIISLISTLAFVTVEKKGEQFKDISYKKFEDMIITSAKEHISSNYNIDNTLKSGKKVTISFEDLVNSNKLDSKNLQNPKTNNKIDISASNVTISYVDYKYNYVVNIVDIQSDN